METVGLGLFFEDLPVGRQFKTIGRTVTEADITNFVNCTGMVEVLFTNLEFLAHESDIKQRLAPAALVYAFAAQAAGSGGALPGVITMAAFGLGTFPAMLMMGGVGGWVRQGFQQSHVRSVQVNFAEGQSTVVRFDWRQYSARMAGGFIVMLGIITFLRGLLPMTAHLHGL